MTEEFEDYEIEPTNEVEGDFYGDEDKPYPGDPRWNDYVMNLLDESEIVDNGSNQMPVCHGLRRVATLLFGKVSGGVKQILYPNPNDFRKVVVVYELRIEDSVSGVIDTYTEVADVSFDNTDEFFLQFPEATASTKAEARCLRKAMLLKNVAADEVKKSDRDKIMGVDGKTPVSGETDGSIEDDAPINNKQIQFLDRLGKIGDIDVDKYLKEKLGDRKLDDVSRSEARDDLIKPLNAMVNGDEDTPKEITGYKENWREE